VQPIPLLSLGGGKEKKVKEKEEKDEKALRPGKLLEQGKIKKGGDNSRHP